MERRVSGGVRCCLLLALGALAASCSRETPTPAVTSSVSTARPATSTSQPEFVAAVAVGATALPLTIAFNLPAAPVVGQSASVALTITVSEPMSRIQIEASGLKLLLDEASAKQVLDDVRPGEPRQLQFSVTPQAAGLIDVELSVQAPVDGATRTSRYAIPVLVEAAPPGEGTVAADS
ncbi:MAG: hypothetical protein LBE59_06070 [Nevskiaceae bacterium]|nr:hypothetical protein [Nevskiaceae bacterium]